MPAIGPRQRHVIAVLTAGPATLSALIHGDPQMAATVKRMAQRGLVRVVDRRGKFDLSRWVQLADEPAPNPTRQRPSGADLEAMATRLRG